MIASDILEKEINLTEMGKKITTELLLTNHCPYLITMVLLMKHNTGSLKIRDFWSKYMTPNLGNASYLEIVVEDGIRCDLIEFIE